MKRWKQTPNTYSEMNVCDDGEWVRYNDAQADKIVYGQTGFENGHKQGYEEGRLDSKPRCTCDIHVVAYKGHTPDCPCYKPPAPKPLESTCSTGPCGNTLIGELLMRLPPPVGTDMPGGSHVAADIKLPVGGTWRRIQ